MDGQLVTDRSASTLAPAGTGRHAYAFYATDTTYAIAVMVFALQLRQWSADANAPMVVLHLRLPGYLVEAMQALGLRTVEVAPLGAVRSSYYRHCLVKLRVLELVEYDRVVLVDADAIPLRSLAGFFALPLVSPIAAPSAYWLDERPGWCTSSLLVVEPRLDLWERVKRRVEAEDRLDHACDMDVLNLEFGGELHRLPEGTFWLDSEWEDDRGPTVLGDRAALRDTVSVVHFTALGKPWSYAPSRARRLRPHAHSFFFELRETWWRAREQVRAAAPLLTRLHLRLHEELCQLVRTKRVLDRLR